MRLTPADVQRLRGWAERIVVLMGSIVGRLDEIKVQIEAVAAETKAANEQTQVGGPPVVTVQLQIPESISAYYDARDKQKTKFKWRPWIMVLLNFLTLVAVTWYACISYGQWQAMLTANQQTKLALHVSQRAYLTIGGPQLDMDKKWVGIPVNNTGHIPSDDVDVILHSALFKTSNPGGPITPNDVIEKSWKRHHFFGAAPGSTYNVGAPINGLVKADLLGATQCIILTGKISYKDGFADDGRQEWLFCMQTMVQLTTKQLFWSPCDIQLILPQVETLDGYPNNEQKY